MNIYYFCVFLFCDKFIISDYSYFLCERKQWISIDFYSESIKIVEWVIIYIFAYSSVYVYYCLKKEFDKIIRENRSEI